jgi:glutathione peroxidase
MARHAITRRLFLAAASTTVAVAGLFIKAPEARPVRMRRTTGMSAFDFNFVSIEEQPLPLAQFRGHPLLVVNTASFCGYTPQYRGLEQLWESYRARGLVVLGVPSNDFGEQEPGTGREIRAFCDTFAVSFPLSRRETVIGANAHPFYRWIATELGEDFLPRWNFHKYLIDRSGALASAWPSQVEPMAQEVRTAVEAALAHPAS